MDRVQLWNSLIQLHIQQGWFTFFNLHDHVIQINKHVALAQ
eukprot:Gb_36993 [translate_table: standard]